MIFPLVCYKLTFEKWMLRPLSDLFSNATAFIHFFFGSNTLTSPSKRVSIPDALDCNKIKENKTLKREFEAFRFTALLRQISCVVFHSIYNNSIKTAKVRKSNKLLTNSVNRRIIKRKYELAK